jgi:putative transposase
MTSHLRKSTAAATRVEKVRIFPTPEQVVRLEAWAGAARTLWNLCTAQRREVRGKAYQFARRPKSPSWVSQSREMTELRAAYGWLADVPARVLMNVIIENDQAWQKFFAEPKRVGQPAFKKRSSTSVSVSLASTEIPKQVSGYAVFPKIGKIRSSKRRRYLDEKIGSLRLLKEGGKFYAIYSYALTAKPSRPAAPEGSVVGIDRGVENVLADSDGNIVKNPRFARVGQDRIRRLSKALSRKPSKGKNWLKAKAKLSQEHLRLRNRRTDLSHKLSAQYAKSHSVVVLEKLDTVRMTKTAGKTLRKSILDAGWGAFARRLQYKIAEAGGRVEFVDPAYTSQDCSGCSYRSRDNRRSQALFVCGRCGLSLHADLNAAVNIKYRVVTRKFKPEESALVTTPTLNQEI